MPEAGQEKFLSVKECSDLAQAMHYKYAALLNGRRFEVAARVEKNVVFASVILRNEDDSFYYPVEARILYEAEEMKPYEAALFLIDYIDIYFEEFWEEAECLYLPIDWADYQYDAVNFQVKGQIFNRKVEQMADDLLAKDEPYTGPNIII